jgi:hypothetical protein
VSAAADVWLCPAAAATAIESMDEELLLPLLVWWGLRLRTRVVSWWAGSVLGVGGVVKVIDLLIYHQLINSSIIYILVYIYMALLFRMT